MGADIIRTIVLLVGTTLFLACVKFAWLAIRGGEGYRAWGLASYGLLVVTPALIGLDRYGEPIFWPGTITYVLSLACGIAALRSAYTVSVEWARLRNHREREHAG